MDLGQATIDLSSINEPLTNGLSGMSGLENILNNESNLSHQFNNQIKS
jgi:hypothetical protein